MPQTKMHSFVESLLNSLTMILSYQTIRFLNELYSYRFHISREGFLELYFTTRNFNLMSYERQLVRFFSICPFMHIDRHFSYMHKMNWSFRILSTITACILNINLKYSLKILYRRLHTHNPTYLSKYKLSNIANIIENNKK